MRPIINYELCIRRYELGQLRKSGIMPLVYLLSKEYNSVLRNKFFQIKLHVNRSAFVMFHLYRAMQQADTFV